MKLILVDLFIAVNDLDYYDSPYDIDFEDDPYRRTEKIYDDSECVI